MKQNDERSELQKQLAAEMQRRASEKSMMTDRPDGVEDSQYVKGSKVTSRSAWVWVVILVMAVALIIWLTVISMSR